MTANTTEPHKRSFEVPTARDNYGDEVRCSAERYEYSTQDKNFSLKKVFEAETVESNEVTLEPLFWPELQDGIIDFNDETGCGNASVDSNPPLYISDVVFLTPLTHTEIKSIRVTNGLIEFCLYFPKLTTNVTMEVRHLGRNYTMGEPFTVTAKVVEASSGSLVIAMVSVMVAVSFLVSTTVIYVMRRGHFFHCGEYEITNDIEETEL